MISVQYCPLTDTSLIEGVKYAGEFFRSLAIATPGQWLRIESREDGVLTVFTPQERMNQFFDSTVSKGIYK